jgi:hypothetical protein
MPQSVALVRLVLAMVGVLTGSKPIQRRVAGPWATAGVAFLVPLLLLGLRERAAAESQWLGPFETRYPAATRVATCGLCHRNFTEFGSINPYGVDFRSAGGTGNASAAIAAIEGFDSDDDGTTNLDEIMTASGFYPGYTCDTYANTVNAPADLADYVDPANVGCQAATTTVQPPTTTTVTSTTTTLPPACAQPLSSGPAPVATDCLYILRVVVGLAICDPACVCAPKGTLPVSATDALICLKKATGQAIALNCPC